MQAMEAAKALATAIQESPEYREYARWKTEVDGDAGVRALLNEYKRLQTALQMKMLYGQQLEGEEDQRFQSLSMLLFADQRTSGYLLAEMQLQKLMGEIFEVLSQAADLEILTPD